MRWYVAPTVHVLHRLWQNVSGRGSRNIGHVYENMSLPFISLRSPAKEREGGFIPCTMHTYAPSAGLLIANQKLCFHSDCLSPLWKVSPVVTKTTIQQWQMNLAHSWVMQWAGDLSINKEANTKPKGRWRTGGMTMTSWKDGKAYSNIHQLCLNNPHNITKFDLKLLQRRH